MDSLRTSTHLNRGWTLTQLLAAAGMLAVVVIGILIYVAVTKDDPKHAVTKKAVAALCRASLPPPDKGTYPIPSNQVPADIEKALGTSLANVMARRVEWTSSVAADAI